MLTDYYDDKKGPKYEVGQPVRTYDQDDEKVVNGVITEVGDESIEVKWEDLQWPTEYERCNITLKDDFIIEH